MKSNLEVDATKSFSTSNAATNIKRQPRSVRKYIRRQKALLRHRFRSGSELEAALAALLNRFYRR